MGNAGGTQGSESTGRKTKVGANRPGQSNRCSNNTAAKKGAEAPIPTVGSNLSHKPSVNRVKKEKKKQKTMGPKSKIRTVVKCSGSTRNLQRNKGRESSQDKRMKRNGHCR